MIEAFAAALAGTVLAQASPGPNLAAVASVALAQGRAAALMVVAGVASGVLIWAAAVAAGLFALVEVYPWSLTALKFLGGGYLIWIALRALRASFSGGVGAIATAGRRRTLWAAWRHGLLVVLTNPKAALMWGAVAAFLFGAGLDGWRVLAFGPVGAASAAVIYGGYALLFSSGLARRAYARAARWIEAAFGLVFGALGAGLVASGLREVRP